MLGVVQRALGLALEYVRVLSSLSAAELIVGATTAAIGLMVLQALRVLLFPSKPVVLEYQPAQVGDVTLEELSKYCGADPFRPILFAVRGRVFDVTAGRDFYGPGGGYSVFAGREIARALGKLAISADECSGEVGDFSERETQVLADWEQKFEAKYTVVGRVVPGLDLSLEALAEHAGQDPAKPLLLAIRGTVFDVTKGKDFYGPEGVYPFAGRECARALGLMSTELSDCSDDLGGLTLSELDTLRDWQGRFWAKYPVVGRTAAGAGGRPEAPAPAAETKKGA